MIIAQVREMRDMTEAIGGKSFDKKKLIKWLILIVIGVLIMLTPATEAYTQEIKIFLTITVCAILMIAFELAPTMVPAVLMPTAYYITGICEPAVAFSGWTTSTGWMIIGALFLANVLDETGLLKRIAYACIRAVGGSFNGVLYGIYIAGVVLAFVSVNSAYAIVVTLGFAICVALKLNPGSKGAAVVMMAAAAGALSPGVFLYRPSWGAIITTNAQTVDPNFQVLWQHFPMYNFPCIIFGFIFIFIMTKVCHTKEMGISGTREYFDKEYAKMGKIGTNEKKAFVMVAILLIYVITSPLHGLAIEYAFMLIPWLSFLPGVNIATADTIRHMNIGTVFFMMACLTIATAGSAIGVPQLISAVLSPLAAQAGPLGFVFIMLIVGIIANLLLTPGAMITALTPIIITICADMDMSPWAPIMSLVYSTDMYFLPHEVTALVLLFGFGMISMKDFFKLATLKTVIYFIGFCLIQIPWYYFVGVL